MIDGQFVGDVWRGLDEKYVLLATPRSTRRVTSCRDRFAAAPPRFDWPTKQEYARRPYGEPPIDELCMARGPTL